MAQQLTVAQALETAVRIYQSGQLQQAVEICRKILSADPNHTGALYLCGLTEFQLGRPEQSAVLLPQAISLQPDFPDAYNTFGAVLQMLGKNSEAIDAFRRAAEQRPDFADAYYNLGHAYRLAGRLDEAVGAFNRTLQLNPSQADAHNSLGVVLYSKQKFDEALGAFHLALQLHPNFAEAHNNIGLALQAQGDYDSAAVAYQSAIAARPDYATAHFNLSTVLLVKGDLARGFLEHEWRWQVPETHLGRRNFPQPQWDGSALNGRRILIHSEQGLGDAIQFARYIPLIHHQRGGRIVLACQSELVRLMQSVDGVDRCIPSSESPDDFDVHCPLGTLPLMFKTTIETIPSHVPYLHAPATQVDFWKKRLSSLQGTKIGLVWSGRASHLNDHNRSIPLELLGPLFESHNTTFLSLQIGANKSHCFPLLDWTADLRDFSDTAALIENLDLIISVDTSVAHLAGAVRKPIWLLLPFVPDWRWLADRKDSPWYPTMELFRQPSIGDWFTPMKQIVQRLSDGDINSRH